MSGFAKISVKPLDDYTVGEFFGTRSRDDLFKINRFLQWMLEKRCGLNAPIWEREAALNKILEEPMNWSLWDDASTAFANPLL